MKDHICENDL